MTDVNASQQGRRHVVTAAPKVTVEAFKSFLECRTKSKLYSRGTAETDLEFKKWLGQERDSFKAIGLSLLRSRCQEGEFYVGTSSIETLKQNRWRTVGFKGCKIRFHKASPAAKANAIKIASVR